jgi:hypothetical protein
MGGYDFRLFPINCFYPCCWGAYGGIAWKGNRISFFFSVFGALNQSMQAKHLFSFPHKQKHVGVYSEGFFFFFFLSNFKK